jgi:hypothetical protein
MLPTVHLYMIPLQRHRNKDALSGWTEGVESWNCMRVRWGTEWGGAAGRARRLGDGFRPPKNSMWQSAASGTCFRCPVLSELDNVGWRTDRATWAVPRGSRLRPMDEPDHAKIAHAIGTDLRERYANALREPFPTHLTGLLAYLAVVEAIGPEHAGEQQSRSESANPARSTEAAYEQAIEMAAQCMLTVARTDEVATAAQAWMLQALRLRGGLADGEQVDRTVLRNVFEDAVSMAEAKTLDQALPQILGHSGEVARVEGTVADGLRQNLQRIAEQFPGVH